MDVIRETEVKLREDRNVIEEEAGKDDDEEEEECRSQSSSLCSLRKS